MKSVNARIFNTTGPGKRNDVCSDFTKRIVEIEKGKREFLPVGNLETKRPICDVRDLIEAFWLATEKGKVGESYNLSGDKVYMIKELLDKMKAMSDAKFEVKQDKNLIRPTDEPIIFGDSGKFIKDTGWEQKIGIEKTLGDMLEYWRKDV
jgi:GDP-4-dehydro-6-deoxy-D-mannose reductase